MIHLTSVQQEFLQSQVFSGKKQFEALIRDPETSQLVLLSLQVCGHACFSASDGPVLRLFLNNRRNEAEGWLELDHCDVWKLWREDARGVAYRIYRATTIAMFPASGFDCLAHSVQVAGDCQSRFREVGRWGFSQDKVSARAVAKHLPDCRACQSVIRRLSEHPEAFTQALAVLANVQVDLKSEQANSEESVSDERTA